MSELEKQKKEEKTVVQEVEAQTEEQQPKEKNFYSESQQDLYIISLQLNMRNVCKKSWTQNLDSFRV